MPFSRLLSSCFNSLSDKFSTESPNKCLYGVIFISHLLCPRSLKTAAENRRRLAARSRERSRLAFELRMTRWSNLRVFSQIVGCTCDIARVQGRSFPYRRVGQLPQLPREPLSPWQLRPRLQLSSCAALPWQRRRAAVRAAGWPRRQQPESKWRARMCWLGLALGPNMSVAVGWAGPARCRRCGRAVRPCPGPAANSSGRPVLAVEI